MNFPWVDEVGSETMLRRILLTLLTAALTAVFILPAAAQGAVDCEQVSLQAPAEGCGEAMAGGTCAVACHAGACIMPSLAEPQSEVKVVQPFARCAVLDCDGTRAPDTAPPKHFIA
jgi:hypothetical protein